MSELKFSIFNYINHFSLYDYMAYIWLLLTFFILIILSIIIMKKSLKISIIMILLSFILLSIGPIILKNFLDKALRATQIKNVNFEKLHFSNTLIVNSVIKNVSEKAFSQCQIKTKVYKSSDSKIKSFINELKPIRYRTILEQRVINPGAIIDNRIVFNNFIYSGDINISIKAECY